MHSHCQSCERIMASIDLQSDLSAERGAPFHLRTCRMLLNSAGACAEANATELHDCTFKTPTMWDPPETLRQLYGMTFLPERAGKGSIVVLGHHNSGTSMLTRLIMLMGAFHGNLSGAQWP